MSVAVVTDSSAMMPIGLIERLGVAVVPIPVVMSGRSFDEGVDLDAEAFYELIGPDAANPPNISTSQPSPGAMIATYRAVIDAGATAIVSVHVGSDFSGTVNSARVAATDVDVPVHVVDSGTASFGVACCVWEAAEAVARGAGAADVAAVAEAVAPTIGTAFVLQAVEVARASGRFAGDLLDTSIGAEEALVLGGIGSDIAVVGSGRDVDELCDHLLAPLAGVAVPVRVGLGTAHPATEVFASELERRLETIATVVDVVRYRVGASVAAHTGVDTAGYFFYPVPDAT